MGIMLIDPDSYESIKGYTSFSDIDLTWTLVRYKESGRLSIHNPEHSLVNLVVEDNRVVKAVISQEPGYLYTEMRFLTLEMQEAAHAMQMFIAKIGEIQR